MKYLVFLIFATLILMTDIPKSDRCDRVTAQIALPVRIFAETVIDGRDQPPVVTRFFHNKVTIASSELSRCYFNFFDPNFIVNSASILGLLPWLYFFYRTFLKIPQYPLLVAIFVVPAVPIFIAFPQVAYLHKVFAIIGLVLATKAR